MKLKTIIAFALITFFSLSVSAYTVTFDAGTGSCSVPSITSETTFTLPNATHPNSEYSFVGWSTEKITEETSTIASAVLSVGTNYTPNENITFYAVYGKVSKITWKKLSASEVTEPGIYVLTTYDISSKQGNTFTGFIDNGYGKISENTITFTNNISNTIPHNTCELTFAGDNTNGFKISKSNNDYLSTSGNTKGCLKWEEYNNSPTWGLNKNKDSFIDNKKNALLRTTTDYKGITTFASGGQPVYFVQKQCTYTSYTSTPPTSYTLTVSAAGYSTFYSSKNAYTMPEGLTGYIFNASQDKIVSTYAAGSVVPADEALVLGGEAKDYTLAYTTTANTKSSENALLGTDTETVLETDANYYFYALSLNKSGANNSVGFYWMNENGAAFTNGAHKAYLKLPQTKAKAAYPFNIDDEVDGITNIVSDQVNGNMYNLSGQRIATTSKGVYIKNGKKYINK